MYITKFVLKNYKRLMLSNIRHFEWTPQSNVMLILGSNGAGKSSVVEELTPCPAHHDQFEADGLKELHCNHNNHSYVLISEYSGRGTGKHKFYRDGMTEADNLNPGGTFAVQKELVLRIFGIDRAMHEILVGITPFTAMPTAKRREWLTKMSPSDLGFIFEKYNLSRSLMSDARGVMNHKAKRMANENIDLPNDAEMAGYRQQITELTERLQSLYRTRGNEPLSPSRGQPLRGRYEDIRSRAKQHLESTPNIPLLYGVKSREEITGQIQVALHQAQACKQQIEELAHELDELEQQKAPVSDFGTPEQIDDMRREVLAIEEKCRGIQQVVQAYEGPWPFVQHEVYPHSKGLLAEMMQTWTTLIQEFPNNHDDHFSHQKGTDARLRFSENKTRLMSLGERHGVATRRLAQLRGCAEVVCPDCTHSFVPGQSPEDVKAAESVALQLADAIEAIEKEQAELGPYIDSYDDYLSFVNRFRQIVRQYDLYKPVWDYAVERRVMFVEPRKHLTSVIAWQTAQTAYIELTEATQRITTIGETLKRYESFDSGHADYIKRRQEAIDHKITHAVDQQHIHIYEANELKGVVKEVDSYNQKTELLTLELEAYMREVNDQIVDMVKLGYDEEIKATSIKLSDIQATLHRFELRENTLMDIEREHREAKQWYADLQLLAKAMSPTDGLIGRYLMGFMQQIVKLLNAIIEELWTYPMEVLPSKVDKDELDYNFPLNIRNGAVTPPDIARGSSSQRDVVNFAFKLIFMKFMGLENFPLYLDEFGNTFDEQHRQNLIPFLNKLIELGEVSQIVYISHFSSTHGAFNHAEIVVLDPTNITLPPVYNRTVKIA
jgi:hypothetical protein